VAGGVPLSIGFLGLVFGKLFCLSCKFFIRFVICVPCTSRIKRPWANPPPFCFLSLHSPPDPVATPGTMLQMVENAGNQASWCDRSGQDTDLLHHLPGPLGVQSLRSGAGQGLMGTCCSPTSISCLPHPPLVRS
ncbi:hypothetical protein AAFF_G00353120, partial [Aldrovandia affinis]